MRVDILKNLISFICLFACFSSNAQHKSRVSFNNNWKFLLDSTRSYADPVVNDEHWRKLRLPHDWSIEGSFSKDHPAGTGGGALPGGIGWYRKTFKIPSAHLTKKVFIEFDGVYQNSEVFINGHSLGVRPNGYISFHYELTPYLKAGDNVIAVKVDNLRQPNSRWYSGSGIYRNVWLTTLDPVHVLHWGTQVTTPEVSGSVAKVFLSHSLSDIAPGKRSYVLISSVFDPAGKRVAQMNTDARKNTGHAFVISQPKLWSVEKPQLYKIVSEVRSNGKTLDSYETTFGIRYFDFDTATGFSLNGKPLKILGVCNHHDLGALGAAVNRRALERQLQILKAMGCNGIRTSHNPPAPELLELADSMGFIVMDEAFDMWAKPKSKYDYAQNWAQWHRRDLEDLVLRDRNHPSVFIWSVGNEIGEQWGDDTSGRNIARELVAIVKSLDTTRPIITANNEVNQWNNLIRSNAFDIIGYNYNHDRWHRFPREWPGKSLIVTESTSALQTRGHYDLVPFDTIRRWPKRWDLPLENGNPGQTVSAYDHVSAPWGSTHEESVKALKKSSHVSGMYIWTGFDYLGEPTPYPWPSRSSYFGIIDLAGFPKDVYYMYQSEFTSKPVLHLYPHWNWKAGDTVDVVAYYNNADIVELFLNGRSLGKRAKAGEDLHVKWRVPFHPGALEVVSSRNGSKVLLKKVTTAGAPAAIVLKADRSSIHTGNDLSFVTATIVDQQGNTVPDADNLISFAISGAGTIAATDNGSPVDLRSFQSSQRNALNGLALAIVQATDKKGTVQLTATCQGLKPATITITVK
jgi:beta-galactosidase